MSLLKRIERARPAAEGEVQTPAVQTPAPPAEGASQPPADTAGRPSGPAARRSVAIRRRDAGARVVPGGEVPRPESARQ